MTRRIENKRDRAGAFAVDRSRFQRTIAARGEVRHLPFEDGQERLISLPSDELLVTAAGADRKLTVGVIALRLGFTSVHEEMGVPRLRHLASVLTAMADAIEAEQ